MIKYDINTEQFQDFLNIAVGLFAPLDGFMSKDDYNSVVTNMSLRDGTIWTIPIALDIKYALYNCLKINDNLNLFYKDTNIGYIIVSSLYKVNIKQNIINIFGTDDINHPGVKKELGKSEYKVGGKLIIKDKSILNNTLNPQDTKRYFKNKGWNTICGFQTRNPIHKAHEHLQRVALEVCDSLFINPLIGWKKVGDFSEEAVINGYKVMLDLYYTDLNVYFDTLKTPMRYAGPREAIFHAIIRKNLGCTHFIIGRDHAGVGDYYGKYEAQELARQLIEKYDIGIELLLLSEPYYCKKCGQIVSDKTCNHDEEYIQKISGTNIRRMLSEGQRPNELFMRPEVADSIIKLENNKFIKE